MPRVPDEHRRRSREDPVMAIAGFRTLPQTVPRAAPVPEGAG